MSDRWFEALRPVCKEACLDAGTAQSTDTVLFYLARWCQKKAKADEPDLGGFESTALRELAERIVRNLAEAGDRVERLVAGDADAFADLERLLLASARSRVQEAAREYAEEALQKTMEVLLTGTPPSGAAERMRDGPRGPGNEYVFHSPFEFWARTIVIRLIIDEHRRFARERRAAEAEATGTHPQPARAPGRRTRPLDRDVLSDALESLPGLVAAIRELPDAQCRAMVMSLSRPEVDELVRERLHELAPDLFSETAAPGPSSDREIAAHLGTTPQRLRSNRSLARGKLEAKNARWKLLLDELMPHASTRPARSHA
jgi:DNA-directed RNA polymerase specialized sigma24 family protein